MPDKSTELVQAPIGLLGEFCFLDTAAFTDTDLENRVQPARCAQWAVCLNPEIRESWSAESYRHAVTNPLVYERVDDKA